MNRKLGDLTFSKNIKYLRERNRLIQLDLAEGIGVKRSLIGAYEEGRAYPPVPILIKISHFFNVSIDDLLLVNIDGHI